MVPRGQIIRARDAKDGDLLCGIAISVANGRTHVGVLHSVAGSKPLLLHMAWHLRLRNESPSEEGIWVIPNIPLERQKSVAAMSRRVWKTCEQAQLPYALKHCTTFDFMGSVRPHPEFAGFTCATFVLALFESCYVKLIDLSSWESRPEDIEWQQEILSILVQTGVAQPHVEAVQRQIGCERYRPEEVAAACALFPPPVQSSPTRAYALHLLQLLRTQRLPSR